MMSMLFLILLMPSSAFAASAQPLNSQPASQIQSGVPVSTTPIQPNPSLVASLPMPEWFNTIDTSAYTGIPLTMINEGWAIVSTNATFQAFYRAYGTKGLQGSMSTSPQYTSFGWQYVLPNGTYFWNIVKYANGTYDETTFITPPSTEGPITTSPPISAFIYFQTGNSTGGSSSSLSMSTVAGGGSS